MRRALVLFLAAATLAAIPSAAGAKPPPSQFAVDFSQCDDGEGSATCVATSQASSDGAIQTKASLSPVTLLASGRAEGRGGLQHVHKTKDSFTFIRYRFVFNQVSARAATQPPITRDLSARAFVAGFVSHMKCDQCEAQGYTLVADADPWTAEPNSVDDGAYAVVVELRNPGGRVPAGHIQVIGFATSDVGPFDGIPQFASSGAAQLEGALTRVEVEGIR